MHLPSGRNGTMLHALTKGLAGHTETYVNGTFTSANQRYDHKVSQALTNNDSANLHIGVFPDNENGGFFQGIVDDVRLWKVFGSEDIQHFNWRSTNIFYKSPEESVEVQRYRS